MEQHAKVEYVEYESQSQAWSIIMLLLSCVDDKAGKTENLDRPFSTLMCFHNREYFCSAFSIRYSFYSVWKHSF